MKGRKAGPINRVLFCFSVFALMQCLATSSARAGMDFPSDQSLPNNFGVFIGINQYQHLSPWNQLQGCVNDAVAMRQFFEGGQFNIKRDVLLTDGQATRQGIGQVLLELVDQVRRARATSTRPINVVITYSGHGCMVDRLLSENDPTRDNAWVASDSTSDFDKVVRGHELLLIHRQLSALGCQVIIISDSCFSGGGYRGSETARSRGLTSDGEKPGPQDLLFKNLPEVSAQRDLENQPLPGFVYYAAVDDAHEAREICVNAKSKVYQGRLSYVMLDLLRRDNEMTTFGELAGQITARFATEFPDQLPQFHAAPGKAREMFFRSGEPPLDAQILSQNAIDQTVDLSLGSLAGVGEGTVFSFYNSTPDILDRGPKSAIATGLVISVGPTTCIVKLDPGKSVPSTAQAIFDAVKMDDFIVAEDGALPEPIDGKLHELDGDKQIVLARAGEPFTVSAHYDAATKSIGLYPPGQMAATQPTEMQAKSLRVVAYNGPDDAENFAVNLLYVARVRRLMNLTRAGVPPLFAASIVPGEAGAAPSIQSDDGIQRLPEDTPFSLHIVPINQGKGTRLYFTVFGLHNDGTLEMVFPTADGGNARDYVEPGGSLDIRGWEASLDNPDIAHGGKELTRLKVIASDHPVDLSFVTAAPDTGMHNIMTGSRGTTASDPLRDLLAEATHGASTRGMRRASLPRGTVWDANDITFYVVKK